MASTAREQYSPDPDESGSREDAECVLKGVPESGSPGGVPGAGQGGAELAGAASAPLSLERVDGDLAALTDVGELLARIRQYQSWDGLTECRENAGVFVEVVAHCERVVAQVEGVKVDFLQRLARSYPWSGQGEELSGRLRITTHAAEKMADRAIALDDYPEVNEALCTGRIDLKKADVFIDATATLPNGLARSVHEALLPMAEELTANQLRGRLRTAALAVDPDLAGERHERAKKERHVSLVPADDGMAYLTFFLTATDAVAAMTTLDALAARKEAGGVGRSEDAAGGGSRNGSRNGSGDERTVGARRVDAFTRIMGETMRSGSTPGGEHVPTQQGKPPRLVITVAQSTLDGDDDAPAYVAGYGPITADAARQLVKDERAHGADRDGAGRDGADSGGAGRDGADRDGADRDGAGRDGAGRDGADRDGADSDGAGRDGADSDGGTKPARGAAHGSVADGRLWQQTVAIYPDGQLAPIAPPPGAAPVSPTLSPDVMFATDGYQPGVELREFVMARDRTCRFPTCRQPAARCQLDHVVPFTADRPAIMQTTAANLHVLCARHHQLKTAGLWAVERDPVTGDTIWASPLGLVYTQSAVNHDLSALLAGPAGLLAVRSAMAGKFPDPKLWNEPTPHPWLEHVPAPGDVGECGDEFRYARSGRSGEEGAFRVGSTRREKRKKRADLGADDDPPF